MGVEAQGYESMSKLIIYIIVHLLIFVMLNEKRRFQGEDEAAGAEDGYGSERMVCPVSGVSEL